MFLQVGILDSVKDRLARVVGGIDVDSERDEGVDQRLRIDPAANWVGSHGVDQGGSARALTAANPRLRIGPARDELPGDGEIGRDTSELQSLAYLVCRLLLEKKKKNQT